MNESNPNQATGPWDSAVNQLRERDPKWADACVKMTTNPWTNEVLSRKLVELVSLGLNAACTNLNHDGTRRHIRAALEVLPAGHAFATPEVLFRKIADEEREDWQKRFAGTRD